MYCGAWCINLRNGVGRVAPCASLVPSGRFSDSVRGGWRGGRLCDRDVHPRNFARRFLKNRGELVQCSGVASWVCGVLLS
jgi:hypothetical protein